MTPESINQIESDLSAPPFRGVPLGSALAFLLHIEIYCGHSDWGAWNAMKNWARIRYHRLRPKIGPDADIPRLKDRVLMTWCDPESRIREIVFPVAKQIGYERCALIFPYPRMAALLPEGASGLMVGQAMRYDVAAWRRDYRQCWRGLRPIVKRTVRRFSLPLGAYQRFADAIVIATQQVAGFQEFLRRSQVAAVLSESDRYDAWAPLVLSAKALGIPTFTLMHGVTNDHCVGYYPVLADTVFCWGEVDRDKLVAAGLDPARATIGGCPRLTRQLDSSPAAARAKLGLDPNKPVVMLGTENILVAERLHLAECFCKAVSGQDSYSAVVRIHPEEELAVYKDLAAKYPQIKFTANDACSLDEALAAADVVVVQCSGLGSDALVKRRLTVILDVLESPLGHGQDLVDQAGCPQATSSESLREILLKLLADGPERRKCERARKEFIERFCVYWGEDSARRIADAVLQAVSKKGTPRAPREETPSRGA
jgi:hypothetical protein